MAVTGLCSVAAVAGCTVLVAACGAGSGTGTGTTNSQAAYSAALRLATCMRAHGVPDFPDPGTAGSHVAEVLPQSDLGSPVFQAAAKTCRKYGSGLGLTPHPLSAAQRRRLIAFSQCMRTHGVPNFPDPTFPASGGARLGAPPSSIGAGTPAFTRAMTACGRPLK
jgi:hypothetical protein